MGEGASNFLIFGALEHAFQKINVINNHSSFLMFLIIWLQRERSFRNYYFFFVGKKLQFLFLLVEPQKIDLLFLFFKQHDQPHFNNKHFYPAFQLEILQRCLECCAPISGYLWVEIFIRSPRLSSIIYKNESFLQKE